MSLFLCYLPFSSISVLSALVNHSLHHLQNYAICMYVWGVDHIWPLHHNHHWSIVLELWDKSCQLWELIAPHLSVWDEWRQMGMGSYGLQWGRFGSVINTLTAIVLCPRLCIETYVIFQHSELSQMLPSVLTPMRLSGYNPTSIQWFWQRHLLCIQALESGCQCPLLQHSRRVLRRGSTYCTSTMIHWHWIMVGYVECVDGFAIFIQAYAITSAFVTCWVPVE
jgi:hypothetical protein